MSKHCIMGKVDAIRYEALRAWRMTSMQLDSHRTYYITRILSNSQSFRVGASRYKCSLDNQFFNRNAQSLRSDEQAGSISTLRSQVIRFYNICVFNFHRNMTVFQQEKQTCSWSIRVYVGLIMGLGDKCWDLFWSLKLLKIYVAPKTYSVPSNKTVAGHNLWPTWSVFQWR